MEKLRCPGCMNEKMQRPVCERCGHDERTPNASHQLPVGSTLQDRYQVGKVLGQGGFGITYIGYDRYLDTPVAIKEYYPSGLVIRDCTYSLSITAFEGEYSSFYSENRQRFYREAKALARFADVPNIVHIQNLFMENNTAYIVMEYLQGVTLKQYIAAQGGKLSMVETLRILTPVMESLQAVHQAGIVHRDLSPDNIMLLPDGKAKLLDFGAVREVHGADADKPLTESTEAILKHGFAPIEQYQRRGGLGPWTDVYAMCATLYYCLTGSTPADAPLRVMGEAEVDWNAVPGLTPQQRTTLTAGMTIAPRQRIPNMTSLIQGFTVSAPIQTEEASKEPPAADTQKNVAATGSRPKRTRRRWLLPLALAAFAAALGIVLLTPRQNKDPQPTATAPSETAETEPYEFDPLDYTMKGRTKEEHYSYAGIDLQHVNTLVFLNSTADAPDHAVDVSYRDNGNVLAWLDGFGSTMYIAADGGVYAPEDSSYLFHYFPHEIQFNGAFYTDHAKNMSHIFADCYYLQDISLEGWNTSRVEDMSGMFASCISLKALDVSGFNTSSVTDMSQMFSDCRSLQELDLSGFNTACVTNMSDMFRECANLESVDVSGFNTSNVTNMSGMFYFCQKLEQLDVSSFDTSHVTQFGFMFFYCTRITNINAKFDTSSAEYYIYFMDEGDTFNGYSWRSLFW